MSSSDAPRRILPARPSEERLRKLARRLARTEGLQLAAAQARLAHDHGYRNWAELLGAARAARRSPLSQAAARADLEAIRDLLAAGAAPDGDGREPDPPLILACGADGPADRRVAAARALLEAGAFPRAFNAAGSTPLHAAARNGPAALVELLLRHGALAWQSDSLGRRPEEEARDGAPIDRDRILELCADGPRIADPAFRAAVVAIQAGDEAGLGRLLDERPDLLSVRAVEPDIGQKGYFSDPKLFWFIANNPTLIPRSPPNIDAIARLMLGRGVEAADVDYALELVMTNGQMTAEEQIGLAATLVDAGGRLSRQSVLMTLGHQQTAVIEWLAARGRPIDAVTAAGLGRMDILPALLENASAEALNDALSVATINHHPEAVRLCLEAGADPNRFMSVHAHSTPLHQAALNGDMAIIALLVAAGARTDVLDTMWRGSPIGWAAHGGQKEAEAYLKTVALSEAPPEPTSG